jgi:hypothetical protein
MTDSPRAMVALVEEEDEGRGQVQRRHHRVGLGDTRAEWSFCCIVSWPYSDSPYKREWNEAEWSRRPRITRALSSVMKTLHCSEQGVRLAQKMQVGPCVPMRIQL